MEYAVRIIKSSRRPGVGDRVIFLNVDMGLSAAKQEQVTIAAVRYEGGELKHLAVRVPGTAFQSGNYGLLSRSYSPANVLMLEVKGERADSDEESPFPVYEVTELLSVPVKREVRERS